MIRTSSNPIYCNFKIYESGGKYDYFIGMSNVFDVYQVMLFNPITQSFGILIPNPQLLYYVLHITYCEGII